jgi:hypothetical protein
MSAQWVIFGAMTAGATPDAFLIPAFHAVEQTHAALVRDAAGDPVAV